MVPNSYFASETASIARILMSSRPTIFVAASITLASPMTTGLQAS